MRKAIFLTCFVAAICVAGSHADGEEPQKKPSQSSLTRGEKDELRRIRKALAACKKTVQADFNCRGCKGSGEKVVSIAGGNKGLKGQRGQKCELCSGYGLGMTNKFFDALNTYYREVASCPQNLQPFIEDPPTVGRWILNQIKGPEVAAALNDHWKRSETKRNAGAASVLAVRITDSYRNSEPKWSVCIAETLEAPGGLPRSMLLVTRGEFLPFTDGQEATGQGRVLVVAYSEGASSYRDLMNESRAALDRKRATSMAREAAREKDATLTRLQKVVNFFNGTKVILTVSDAIVCPPRFYGK